MCVCVRARVRVCVWPQYLIFSYIIVYIFNVSNTWLTDTHAPILGLCNNYLALTWK